MSSISNRLSHHDAELRAVALAGVAAQQARGIGAPKRLHACTDSPTQAKFSAQVGRQQPVETLAGPESLESAWPTQITPWLYLGSAQQAASAHRLRQLFITHIVNVTRSSPPKLKDIGYLQIAACDSVQERLAPRFFEVAAFVKNAKDNGGKTLIHCQEGISRSATLVLATRIIDERISLAEAFAQVRAKRAIEPNNQFLFELRQLELHLFDTWTEKKLTPLDENKSPSFFALKREMVFGALAKAAQIPDEDPRGWPEFDSALIVLRGFYQDARIFENCVFKALEMFASNSPYDAAGRAALSHLLVALCLRLTTTESPLIFRLNRLFVSDLFRDASLDAPLIPRFATELLSVLKREPSPGLQDA